MKIGVTGTRNIPNRSQFDRVYDFLNSAIEHCKEKEEDMWPPELHHGDCIGADEMVAKIAMMLGFKVICHPPENTVLRAYQTSHETRVPLSYFHRNRNIVDETDFLIAVPYQDSHQSTGGTWYTVDYAVKKNKQVKIFYPNLS
jgi:hypothetical protein